MEYIRSAVIRDNRRTSGFHVIYDNGLLPGKALTLIDGVPIFDFDYMMNYDPLIVERIGIVNDVYRMGNIEYHGIIDFTTYQGDFDGQEFPGYIVGKSLPWIATAQVVLCSGLLRTSRPAGKNSRLSQYLVLES